MTVSMLMFYINITLFFQIIIFIIIFIINNLSLS